MKGNTALTALTAVAAGVVTLAAACSSASTGSPAAGSPAAGSSAQASKTPLTLMFGSSGPAETQAVQAAAAAFTSTSGIKVNVVAASNLTQQLAQGFAGGHPPDVFYLDPGTFQNYAKDGALDPYAGTLSNAGDFYPALRAAFTYKGTFICDPKDASTLALYVNTKDWQQAGLTSADIPTNWNQLAAVAKKLTVAGRAGLTASAGHSELDEFMYQNGGTIVNGGTVQLNSPQNVQALAYLKGLQPPGAFKFPSQLSSGWGGEAFGKNKAAMDIEGNWLVGAMKADYPSISYQVVPLPAGPAGTKATISFTNCWAIPRQSANLPGAVDFVKFLTMPAQQQAFAKAFGVIPSLSSLQGWFDTTFPALAVHTQELAYAQPDIALPGDTQALAAFDSALAQLASSDPATILTSAQQNLQAVVNQSK